MYRKEVGFTLIELLVVVAIISILAAVAIPAYVGVQLKAARSEAYTNLENIRLLQEQLFADSGCYEPLVDVVVAGVTTPTCPPGPTTFTCVFNDANNCIDPGEIAQAAAPPLRPFLTRFRPGAGRKFSYRIRVATGVGLPTPVTVPYVPWAVGPALVPATTRCFIATATGADGKVAVAQAGNTPDVFAIDCNNNRNF